MDGIGVVVLVVAALVAGGAWWFEHQRRARLHRDLGRLLARDRQLMVTVTPCGLDAEALATSFASCPAGDRHRGVRHGVEGPLTVELPGGARTVRCAAFEWWWEERRQQRSSRPGGGAVTTTRYDTRRTTLAVIELPTPVWRRVLVRPEGLLGRSGVTRGGVQLESDAFNRRFRVECRDRGLAVQLLDPGLQRLLLDAFQGRTIELFQGVLLLAGTPTHRDDSLTGTVGELPAVRQDVARLLRSVPAQFWRAAATDGTGS